MLHPTSSTCVIEMTPPRRDAGNLAETLPRFAARFRWAMDRGYVASLSDNVMGVPHFQALEMLDSLELSPRPDQVIVHVNTFHTPRQLDEILMGCRARGISNLLCLTGDGSPRLPKLQPDQVEAPEVPVVTSVELVRYIKKYAPDFACGVAFNPYNPPEEELAKLDRKAAAGADFVITQPVLGRHPNLDRAMAAHPDLPVIVECWMSKNLKLLAELIGPVPEGDYDGFATLQALREVYPRSGNCLSMLPRGREGDVRF